MAALFDSCQHRVTGYSSLTVGKATDADILWHAEPHVFGGIQDADGSIVVDGKEAIGRRVFLQHVWRDSLCVGTVVTDVCQLRVILQPVFAEGILIAVETVLRNLQIHLRAIKGNTRTTGLYQIADRVEGSHIVVDNHTTGIHARTYSIIEHEWQTIVEQHLEMLIAMGVLRLRNNDATHLILIERATDIHLPFITLTTMSHQDAIAATGCFFLNACQYRREIEMGKLRDDNAYHLHWLLTRETQQARNDIRCEIMLTGILLNQRTALLRDARRVLQGTRYRGHRDSQLAGYILHCQRCCFFHIELVVYAK